MKRIGCMIMAVALMMGIVLPTAAEDTAAPDLVVTAIHWQGDGQVAPGTALTFAVTVKNEGTAAVEDAFTVDIGFGTQRLFRLTHEGGVPVGETAVLRSPVWTAQSGDRMVTARVNSTNTVAEVESWDNDTLQRNLRVGEGRYEPMEGAMRDAAYEAGMVDLTFNDDFDDTAAFDVDQTGVEGYKWYTRRHSAFQKFTEGDYYTENGILTMACKIDTFAIGGATIDRRTGIGYTFTHGYLEFRLRMPTAGEKDESKTAIWSFPRERYVDGGKYTTHVEMDWLEYYGGDYFTVTMHEQHTPPGVWDWYASSDGNYQGLGDEQWHTMGYLWEEGRLRCYLDGELFREQTWGPDEIPIPIHDIKQGEIKFEGVFSYADTQDMMLFIFGSKKIPLELDYVRVWQCATEAPPAPPAPTTPPTTGTTVPPKAPKPLPWWPFAAGGALLLGAAATWVILKKKK